LTSKTRHRRQPEHCEELTGAVKPRSAEPHEQLLCAMYGEGKSNDQPQKEGPDVHMSPFVLYPRVPRISFLACLHAPKLPAFELALRLEPIVQLAAGLFAAFEIDCVCATSDFLMTHRVPY